jgi:hypothetical protein
MFDTFDNNKFSNRSEWAVMEYKSLPFPPIEEKYKFPERQFLIIKKKMKEVLFDYIEYRYNTKIFSLELLNYLKTNGLNYGYETSELIVIDKSGNELTGKKYFALRFGSFDDDLFDFNEKTKQRTKVHGSTNYTFPDIKLKNYCNEKSVFVLNEFSYRNAVIIKGSLINELLKYYKTEIYKISDFPYIYENQYDEKILPVNNEYKINFKK